MMLRMATVSEAMARDEMRGAVKLMFVDVWKAHLSGWLRDSEFACVSLSKEAGGGVEKLKRWLCGMRPAASSWEDDYVEHLRGEEFLRGRSPPTAMLHEERGIRLVVWRDDFAFLGSDLDLEWATSVMTKRHEMKVRAILGPEHHDDKEVRILSRKARWEADRILRAIRSTSTRSSAGRVGMAIREVWIFPLCSKPRGASSMSGGIVTFTACTLKSCKHTKRP